ncbi:MAG: 4Fe-4S binding protein [Nitrospiraceae bacterium]|nr:4Fe-4S binding protein [Nitrospiraceae bacterium]
MIGGRGVSAERPAGRMIAVAGLGFFALVAQTLLFRDFFTVFEGSELGVGAFFGSWFIWVALGALAGRIPSRLHDAAAGHVRVLALLYIPAFVLQHSVVLHTRELAGVEAYELFPFAPMLIASFAVNAPTSFLTGSLFALACRWVAEQSKHAVSRVYISETLGACAGGVFVTVLLVWGLPGEAVFAAAAWALCAVLGVSAMLTGCRLRAGLAIMAVVGMLGAGLFCGGVGARWADYEQRAAWSRLLPAEQYGGSFSTAQSRYLYGWRENQLMVISGGGVSETFPGDDQAGAVVALHMAQRPEARNVLVFGENALGICAAFKMLPQIQHVTWLHPDRAYPRTLMEALADEGRSAAGPDEIPQKDIRTFARETQRRFDLIVLNLPDMTTLVLNRYATVEFFTLMASILETDGLVSVRVSGGENYVGGELALLGASMLDTLDAVFLKTILTPGEDTWFLAANGGGLMERPEWLARRYAGIEGASAVYPPEGVRGLYRPGRAAFQMDAYRAAMAETPRNLLRNTDRSPKALAYNLLLAVKQAEWRRLARSLPALWRVGPWLLAGPVLLYALLRLVFLLKTRWTTGDDGVTDLKFLVFTMGVASISLSIVLMFLYQVQFGTLFLHMGVITALFMAGSLVGAMGSARFLTRWPRGPLLVCLTGHLLLFGGVALLPGAASRGTYAGLFALCGAFTGVYFPIAAARLAAAGAPVRASGAGLEMLDHLGGAVGASLTGLVLLPMWGATAALGVLALLVGVNGPLLALSRTPKTRGDAFDRLVRPAAYATAGVAIYLLGVSAAVAHGEPATMGDPVVDAARTMAGATELESKEAVLPDGTAVVYFAVTESDDRAKGYVFPCDPWASKVYGYLGPIQLAAYTDAQGVLLDYAVLRSYETPSYLYHVESFHDRLMGASLFTAGPFDGVDAVSGATITDVAIRRTLTLAGQGFARDVLGVNGELEPAPAPSAADFFGSTGFRDFAVLAALTLAAILHRYRPRVWSRRAILLTSLLAAGLWLNLQYSTQQVISLAGLTLGGVVLNGPFFLLVVVPVVVVLFGNVYCGYVCPFGALQELVGDLAPKRLRGGVDKQAWRYGRAVKYGLLFLVLAAFALTRDYGRLEADPLVSVFGMARERPVVIIVVLSVALSLFYKRFWCRNLCPAGAFLSWLNGARLLGRLIPRRYPERCDLGVRSNAELDCIMCDRCGWTRPETSRSRRVLMVHGVCVAAAAAIFAGAMFSGEPPVEAGSAVPGIGEADVPTGAGQARDVDAERIRTLIDQGHLSGREAEYYGPVSADGPAPDMP